MNELVHVIENEQLLDDGVQHGLHQRLAALAPTESPRLGGGAVQIYLRSLTWQNGVLFGVARYGPEAFERNDDAVAEGARVLFCAADHRPHDSAVGRLRLAEVSSAKPWIATAELSVENARALHELFPWTKPTSLRRRKTTLGMGDRLGIATPGHLRAARQFDIAPVLAQQSVRENEFIGRTFDDVVANATWSVFQEGYRTGYGADGDHLKNGSLIDLALAASMPMITLDLTEVMRPDVAKWSDTEIETAFTELEQTFRVRVETEYCDQTFRITDGVTVSYTAIEAKRCAVMYGPALAFSREINDHLDSMTGGAYDLEISIDETTTPTLPSHHLFIARELHHRGVQVNSIAPRFVGEFQKAIDYIGDTTEFAEQFRVHCFIAAANGNYKISVHSGSDKYRVFPIVGRETGLRFHLKTSGTSWLVAIETIAECDPALYRRIHAFALSYYPKALTHYHITADFDAIAPLDDVPDGALRDYLSDVNARQMLHISYGGILQNEELRTALYASLHHYEEEYAEALRRHFEKHIEGLGVPRV